MIKKTILKRKQIKEKRRQIGTRGFSRLSSDGNRSNMRTVKSNTGHDLLSTWIIDLLVCLPLMVLLPFEGLIVTTVGAFIILLVSINSHLLALQRRLNPFLAFATFFFFSCLCSCLVLHSLKPTVVKKVALTDIVEI